MTKRFASPSELALVQRLRSRLGKSKSSGVLRGIGDDTAVLRPVRKGLLELFTCDGILEGVHFHKNLNPLYIGHKAMACNVSDIAAMGGVPTYAVIGLGLPRGYPTRNVDALYRGLKGCARRFDVAIVGGDTVLSPGGLCVWVSLLGWVERRCLKLRSAAKPGDAVFVTGTLGGSIVGKHAAFAPRLREARFLASNFPVHAMMDISDGLALDLQRICQESRVHARIDIDALPIAREAKTLATRAQRAWQRAVGDGEDYELLFTLPAAWATRITRAFRRRFPLELTRVGEIVPAARPGKTVRFYSQKSKKEVTLSHAGYDHFR